MNDDISCFKVTVAYDGTDFCGWERQAQGERTIQGVFEESLFRLTGKSVKIAASGRTDSGVHALGQVVSFSIDKEITTRTLYKALNALLPRDIRVLQAEEVPQDFHARFSARYKTYFYQILEAPYDNPFKSRYFHRVDKLPDTDAVRAAASILTGKRDFAALQASGSDARTTCRNVHSIRVKTGKDWIRVFFTADGFLYRMVRNMISLIMAQAEGRISRQQALEILASRDRTLAPPTYPAKGLFLWRVCY